MRLISCYFFAVVLSLSITLGEEKNVGEFIANIPSQIEDTWKRLVGAIKRPVVVRRHFYKKSKLTSKRQKEESTTPITFTALRRMNDENQIIYSGIPLVLPQEKSSPSNKRKVKIPTLGTKNRYWTVIGYLKKHGFKCSDPDICDHGFQEYPDMRLRAITTSPLGPKPFQIQLLSETTTLKQKLRIPHVKEPRYTNVNQWNNMQRPSFAEIQVITPGSSRSRQRKVTKLYEVLYNAKLTGNSNNNDDDDDDRNIGNSLNLVNENDCEKYSSNVQFYQRNMI